MKKPLLGFIGQGWIGKNYSDDFEKRGYKVVRYALEAPYNANKEKIKECEIVFIAVPTPTTPKGFDDSIVRKVLLLVGKGKVAVIKSTMLMGRTEDIQNKTSHCLVLNSPEFLSEATAAYDAAHPDRNVVGLPRDTKEYRDAAKKVLAVLPSAPSSLICTSGEAEFIKYVHNVHGYIQVVFSNMLYDLALKQKYNWEILVGAFRADPAMSHQYLKPIHKSGRGAGGNCFIKDFEVFIEVYKKALKDTKGLKVFESIREKNLELLLNSGKDLNLLSGVYGKKILVKKSPKISKSKAVKI